jgi:hypothetical protein
MYSGLTNKLNAAVYSGVFTTLIRRNAVIFDAPELAGASGTGVVSGDPVIQEPPHSGGGLGGGEIAGIVIGVVFGATLIAIAIFFIFFYTAGTTAAASSAPAAVNMQEI